MDNHIAVIGAGRMRNSIIDFLLSKGGKVTAITRTPEQAENLNGKWKKQSAASLNTARPPKTRLLT
jgi:glutamyl-tRNA reductase